MTIKTLFGAAPGSQGKAFVTWGRNNMTGSVRAHATDLPYYFYNRVVDRIGSTWVTVSPFAGGCIYITQPLPKWMGGAGEREQVDKLVKHARNVAKDVLREMGYSVR